MFDSVQTPIPDPGPVAPLTGMTGGGRPPRAAFRQLTHWLVLWLVAIGITLGAPVLRSESLVEENPEEQAEVHKVSPQAAATQTEVRRRQPQLFPAPPRFAGRHLVHASRRMAAIQPRAPPLAAGHLSRAPPART